MMGGFLVRLMLLAVIILGIPRTWMNHNAFVITFLLAFMIGIAVIVFAPTTWIHAAGRTLTRPARNLVEEREVEGLDERVLWLSLVSGPGHGPNALPPRARLRRGLASADLSRWHFLSLVFLCSAVCRLHSTHLVAQHSA